MNQNRRTRYIFIFIMTWLVFTLACGNSAPIDPNVTIEPGDNNDSLPPPSGNGNGGRRAEAESNRNGVFTLGVDGQRQPLNAPDRKFLVVNEGLDVDDLGRAIIRFADLFSVELLRDGELILKELDVSERSAIVTLIQNGGALFNDFNPDAEISRRFTIETEFAVITATGTRFLVVREANSPLEWVVALEAGLGELEVTAGGVTKEVTGGEARWVAPIDEPGAAFRADMTNVQEWLTDLQEGHFVREIGEIVWEPADMLFNMSPLTALPAIGVPFTLGTPVVLTLEPPTSTRGGYWLTDCNGDGVLDIVIRDGLVSMDFRPVLGRVSALDVTVINLDEPGSAQVRVLDPGLNEINRKSLLAGRNQGEIVDFRAGVPFHYAELVMDYGCFLGASLTPPHPDGSPGPARPATGEWQEADSSEWTRPPDNGQMVALPVTFQPDDDVFTQAIFIDGRTSDWEFVLGQNNMSLTPISHIVHNVNCSVDIRSGLAAWTAFAYDDNYLLVAFFVQDPIYVPYSGSDQRYFLGDSPQLLLDLNLAGDFHDPQLSSDDIQIDFHPGSPQPGEGARAALWQLHSQPLQSRELRDALVAAVPVNNGYFLEAAIPWDILGITPEPGLRMGIAASVSDNNSLGSDRQECMISTAPNRNWQSPPTWGTLILGE